MVGAVGSLESQCITSYLRYLEGSCATFIHLATKSESVEHTIFRSLLPRILPLLKEQLNSFLSGTCSSSIRQEMLERLFSGQFPTEPYSFTYREINPIDGITSQLTEGRDRIREIKDHGSKCCSLCCTGGFIVETMACVIVNYELKEIRVDDNIQNRIFDRSKAIRKYLGFDLPSILIHYEASLAAISEAADKEAKRIPQLEKLIIKDTGLKNREFSELQDDPIVMLNVFEETQRYLRFPEWLASTVESPADHGVPYAEDLFLALTDIFSKSVGYFSKLTHIVFGSELKDFNIYDRFGDLMIAKLFGGIGITCSSLRVLDLSASLSIPTETFVHLFFQHTNESLHRYTYLPPYQVVNNFITYKDEYSPSEVYKHNNDQYCPWCLDDCCENGIRFHNGHTTPFPVIDDRLYAKILESHPEKGRKYLSHVVTASDLWRSCLEPLPYLTRPPSEQACTPSFNPNIDERVIDGYSDTFWYPPQKNAKIVYADHGDAWMNKLCSSLQILKIGQMGPRHELLPFLLTALTKIKSLGSMDVLRGLRFIRDNPVLSANATSFNLGLEEVSIDIVDRHFNNDWLTATSWAPLEIKKDIQEFYKDQDEPQLTVHEKRLRLQEDLKLLAEQCKNVATLRMFLYMEELTPELGWMWEGLGQLHHLVDITLLCIDWDQITPILENVGGRLRKVCISVTPPPSLADTSQVGPAINAIFDLCPRLQALKVDVSSAALKISRDLEFSTPPDLSNLTQLTVGHYLTQAAFQWVWEHAVNLEEVLIPTICSADTIEMFSPQSYQVYYTESMINRLCRKNKMKNLVKLKVYFCLADVEAAQLLINTISENCEHLKEMGKLTIRVRFEEDQYPNHEDLILALTDAAREMRLFSGKVQTLSIARSLKITYCWEKSGILANLDLDY